MRQTWRNWLTVRPIAHRGLHDKAMRVVENSLAAAEAAIVRNFAIECDVQISADGEAVVFHDFDLKRLTNRSETIALMKTAELTRTGYRDGQGYIPTLDQFLDAVAGRVPLVIEIKSDFSGNMTLAERTAKIVAGRNHPLALKSFDSQVISHLRANAKALGLGTVPLGMVAEANYEGKYWQALNTGRRVELAQFLHWRETRPDFLSWHVNDLPHVTPYLLRNALNVPVMSWTVRTAEQKERAAQWADQIVFEETQGLRIE